MLHSLPCIRSARSIVALAILACAVACGPRPPLAPMAPHAPPPPHAMPCGGDHPCMGAHHGDAPGPCSDHGEPCPHHDEKPCDEPDGKPCGHSDGEPCDHSAPGAHGGDGEPMPCDHEPGHEAKGEMPCHEGASMPCAHSMARHRDGIRWTDLATLAATLPPAPLDVVFDVDDTVLFTSPGFQWGTRTYGAEVVKAGAPVREADLPSDDARRRFREFWSKMNNELDQWSVKKWIAVELIKLHKMRGDRIHFVTKRVRTGSEKVTELIAKTFDLAGMEPVIFTDRNPKVEAFKQVHAAVSYGDSDGDIRDSLAAGARPVRVQRARNSVNDDPTHDGAFGEEVLIDSAN